MTGALSRLTKNSIVTTNFHSNHVQGMSERSSTSTYPRRCNWSRHAREASYLISVAL